MSVQCILGEGDLPVKILWKFRNEPVESDYGVMISALGARVSNLMIESVEGRHAGNYTCSAENRAGIKTYTAELEVIGTESLLIVCFFFLLFSSPRPTNPFKFRLAYLHSRSATSLPVLATPFLSNAR